MGIWVYDATVKMVYLNQTASEAVWFNVILEKNSGNMTELRENFCIKSGKAKGNQTYYVKDGKNILFQDINLPNLCVRLLQAIL